MHAENVLHSPNFEPQPPKFNFDLGKLDTKGKLALLLTYMFNFPIKVERRISGTRGPIQLAVPRPRDVLDHSRVSETE